MYATSSKGVYELTLIERASRTLKKFKQNAVKSEHSDQKVTEEVEKLVSKFG